MPTPEYSQKPLYQKLGLKTGDTLKLINAPNNYPEILSETPENIQYIPETDTLTQVNIIHFFPQSIEDYEIQINNLKNQILPNGTIWVSWDKTKSKLPHQLNENIIRDTALALGLVDVKVCSVSDTWSGLKLVWRKENRKV